MNSALKKNIKTGIIYFLIILVTLEVSPFILGSFFLEKGYSRQGTRADLTRVAAFTGAADTAATDDIRDGYLSEHILHPYLGYVHRQEATYNQFGFLHTIPVVKRADSVLNICLLGGSVAKQLYQYSGEELKRLLHSFPVYKDKKINIVVLALGGFKQPQQLIALNYFLSLGAEYDIVINLDGFNEVVLPWSDNLPFQVFPSFPRHWNIYARKSLPQDVIILLGKQAVIREKQKDNAIFLLRNPLRYSNLALFLWEMDNRVKTARISELENLLRDALTRTGRDIQSHGPDYSESDTAMFFSEQARIWAQSSRQMYALANNLGFSYYHFLQPNQYVEGSKALTDEEMTVAFEGGRYNYKEAVHLGYPSLIREGKQLEQEGIPFYDLTQMFAHEKASVYSDKCCHFNKKGYDAIAAEIVRSVTSADN